MNEKRDINNNQHNSIYYNQILRASERKKRTSDKKEDFGAKEIDLSKYLFSIRGYESVFYTLYIICIPYIVGIAFLFFYVAKAAHEHFSLLELNSFLIVWAIGYEITSAILLSIIFYAFIKHVQHSK